MSTPDDILLNTPLATFTHDKDTPPGTLRRVFGPDVLTRRTLTAGRTTGAWFDGYVALLPSPTGWTGIYLESGQFADPWGTTKPAPRIMRVMSAMEAPLLTGVADLIGVAEECVRILARQQITGWDHRSGENIIGWRHNVSLPRYTIGWLLTLAVETLAPTAAERDRLWTLLALATDADQAAGARSVLADLKHLYANQAAEGDAERLLLDIIEDRTGQRPATDALHFVVPPVALLRTPRAQWPEEALRLLTATTLLDPQPTPPTSPPERRGPSNSAGFIIAA